MSEEEEAVNSSASTMNTSDEEEETTPPVTDTVDGAVGGAICPPGEEVEINMEVAQRKRVIDRLLDKFEEVCPRRKLGKTRQFVKLQQNSKVTRIAMAKWKVEFRSLIRHQEDVIRSIRSPTTEAKEAYDALFKMLEEMYAAQANKIDNYLSKFEDAREEYAVWKKTAKRTQMVFEAGSRPVTPNPEGKWKGDEIFKPSYLTESPNPLEFNEWKAKFQK